MREPLETAELQAFVAIVDAKSLTRAAAELSLPRATIGRRLARLEERLGTRLLRRTTRSLMLTPAGALFYERARGVLEAVSSAEASIRDADPAARGPLRVSVPPIVSEGFYATVCEFVKRHPEVRLQLNFSTARVDLQRGGYDVALRAGAGLEPGLVARVLSRDPIIAVASPRYLAKHGTPRSRADLRAHRCLMSFGRGDLPQTHWPWGASGQVHVDGVMFSNDVGLLCDAARRGLGIAMLPQLMVRGLVESGNLVQVLPGQLEAAAQIALVYAERKFVPPHLRAFIEAISAWAQTSMELTEPLQARRRRRR